MQMVSRSFAMASVLVILSMSKPATAETAVQIIAHHIQAFRNGDVDMLVADYADDAVFWRSNGTIKGISNIRKLFEMLTDERSVPGRKTFEGTVERLTNDVFFEHWVMSRGTSQEKSGTDIIVMAKDKIIYQAVLPPNPASP